MRFTATTATLIAALARVAPAAGGTLPVLANALITVADRCVSIRAGGVDLDARVQIAGDDTVPGAVCVNPKDLLACLRTMRGESVDVTLDGARLNVRGGRARADLATIDAAEYPTATATTGSTHDVDAQALARALKAVEHAVSEDEGRPHLGGVHIGDQMLSATDGHRLARHPLPGLTGDAIVPREAVVQLLRALPASGTVQVTLSRERITVAADGYSVAARLIDGAFPNVANVIPAPSPAWVAAPRLEMHSAVRGVMALAPAKSRKLTLTRDGDTIALSAHDADRGELATSIHSSGEWSGTVSVNGDYLVDTLNACTGDDVVVEIRDSLSPIVVREGGAVYVVMPLRG